MSELQERLLAEISKIPVIDTHSRIDPHRPTARDLDDLLGHHDYTALVHSAGMGQDALRSEVPAEDRARAIARYLPAIENTCQYSSLLEIALEVFDFSHERIDDSSIDALSRLSSRLLESEGWESNLFYRSNIERIFLTNAFDDPLEGIDTGRYVPSLDLNDLIFDLGSASVIERLRQTSQRDAGNAASFVDALEAVFARFADGGARAALVALPPGFAPGPVDDSAAEPILRRLLAGSRLDSREEALVSRFVLWRSAELCSEHGIPLNLMLGVHRNVYKGGVHQGRDLPGRLSSLHPFEVLFNSFPGVTFPVSILSADGGQELVSYASVFPNVVAHGHWWYANLPAYVEMDTRARLQGLPRTKQIGCFSEATKLEFVLPRFRTYRRILAKILAEDYVEERRWSEEKAVRLASDLLRGNAERTFLERRAEPATA